jgi:glycosyltransferase involved in cell wall biosynthesis
VVTLPLSEGLALKIVIATGRQAHYRLAANSFVRRGYEVSLHSATPRSRMRGFDPAVQNQWIPAPVAMFSALTHTRTPLILDEFDSICFDRWAAATLQDCDLLLGASTSSLVTGKAAQRMGGIYVLDRACPDIRVQQRMLVEEARKVGGTFKANSMWFIDRQVQEYEQADFILAPSEYSRHSFPNHLLKKVVLAPLYGCSAVLPRYPKAPGAAFVLGVVGGGPLRKGFFYLLQAWKELGLARAELKIRTSTEIFTYPVLKQLLVELPTVSVVDYVLDINAFYASCDAFILPSVDDGFGLSLMEAMANGVPSIATRNCGATELMIPDRDCLLIDAFSVDQIKDAILRLYESAELRERLEENGPKAVGRLQEGGVARPYEEGIDRLLYEIERSKLAKSAV